MPRNSNVFSIAISHTVSPDLGRNCLQRSSADEKLPLIGKDLIIKLNSFFV